MLKIGYMWNVVNMRDVFMSSLIKFIQLIKTLKVCETFHENAIFGKSEIESYNFTV